MRLNRLLASAFLSAGLGSVSLAEEVQPFPADNSFELHGSDQAISPLQNFKNVFLNLAQNDVLVISRQDLLDPQTISAMRSAQYLGTDPVDLINLDETTEKLRDILKDYEEYIPTAEMLTALSGIFATTDGMAMRPGGLLPLDGPCIIRAADTDSRSQELLTLLAGLPMSHSPMVRTQATSDEIYELIMLHEAHHCAQPTEVHENAVDYALYRLGDEIGADQVAFASFRTMHADNLDRANAIIAEFRNARSISNIRNSNSLADLDGYYLDHGAALYGTPLTHDHTAAFTEAELIFAAQFVNFILDIQAVTHYLLPLKDTALNSEAVLADETDAGQTIWSKVKELRRENPLLEYAMLSEFHAFLSQGENYAQRITEYPTLAAIDSLMNDYMNAMQSLVPDIETFAEIKTHREFLAGIYAELKAQPQINPDEVPPEAADKTTPENNACGIIGPTIDKSAYEILVLQEDLRRCLLTLNPVP